MAADRTVEALIERARALVPAHRERAADAEAEGTLAAETVAELKRSGLLRLLRPKRHGGLERDLATYARVVFALGRGCGATTWTFAAWVANEWLGARFTAQAQKELWGADPDAIIASSRTVGGSALAVSEGMLLSGHWHDASGIDHADWAIVCADGAGGGSGHVFALLPRQDFTIVGNDGDALGLAASGSRTIELQDRIVPAHRVLAVSAQVENAPGAASGLDRAPLSAVLGAASVLPVIAIAAGAFDDYVEATRTRTTRGAALGGARQMAEFPTIQHRVGEAAAMIDAARLLIECDLAEATEGRALAPEAIQRHLRNQSYAARLARQAMDLLYESAGGQILFSHHRLQRAWRDVHAGCKRMDRHWDAIATRYGRFVLGLASETG